MLFLLSTLLFFRVYALKQKTTSALAVWKSWEELEVNTVFRNHVLSSLELRRIESYTLGTGH